MGHPPETGAITGNFTISGDPLPTGREDYLSIDQSGNLNASGGSDTNGNEWSFGIGVPCSGGGLPCNVVSLGPSGLKSAPEITADVNERFQGTYWGYKVMDVNQQDITVTLNIQEFLIGLWQDGVGDPNASPPFNPVSSPFHDVIGNSGFFTQNTNIGFQNLQFFVATLNGISYLLSPAIVQTNIVSNGLLVVSRPSLTGP